MITLFVLTIILGNTLATLPALNNEIVDIPFYLGQYIDLTESSNPPIEVQSHTAVISTDGRYMFVFGGQTPTGLTNDFLRYDIEQNIWQFLVPAGNVPSPRRKHSAVVYDNKMYVFGGFDAKYQVLNDLYVVNLDPNTGHIWKELMPSGDSPQPRWRHTSQVTSQGIILIYGGQSISETQAVTFLGDIVRYDPSTNAWLPSISPPNSPVPRSLMTSFIDGDNLYVFDGIYGFGGYKYTLGELYRFEYASQEWTLLDPASKPPSARAQHASVRLSNGAFISIAGYDTLFLYSIVVYDPVVNSWGRVLEDGDAPIPGLIEHSAVVVPSSPEATEWDVFIFGGSKAYSQVNELRKIHLVKSSWRGSVINV